MGILSRAPDSRFPVSLTISVLLLAVDSTFFSPGARAQDSRDLCGFDVCALRIEPGGFFTGNQVVRGAEGTRVSKVGRTDELLRLFATVDSAAYYYASFEVNDLQAQRVGRIGAVAWVVGFGLMVLPSDDNLNAVGFGFNLGGLALIIGSYWPRSRGSRDLAKAIWWYNRALPPGS